MADPTIRCMHHAAFRCRDAEQTRWFYEDVLGLELAAALALDEQSGTGEPRSYLHIFFAMGDGNYLAFFDDPDHATGDAFQRQDPFDAHIALEVDEETQRLMKARIRAAGVFCSDSIDHDFVRSIYCHDPNGVQVELTCKVDRHDAIMGDEAAAAREQLAAWTKRTRERKEKLFGAKRLDWRGKKS